MKPEAAGRTDGVNMLTDKHTLQQLLPARHTYIMLALLLGNVGLQIFSHVGLSAVVKSNQGCNEGGAFNFSSGAGTSSFGACLLDSNYTDWLTYWNAGGAAQYKDAQAACSVTYGTIVRAFDFGIATQTDLDNAASDYMLCIEGVGVVGPLGCKGCYADAVSCGTQECINPCLSGSESPACLSCNEAFCYPAFTTCAGEAIPLSRRRALSPQSPLPSLTAATSPAPAARLLAAGSRRELADVEKSDLCVVFELSFISSMQEAIAGEAYAIAVVVVFFSGAWPYLKNVIMFVAWFVPMTSGTRSTMLKNLTRLAKWSLVDVFAVVIILAGVNINKEITPGQPLIVVAESRIAIYTFCIAAIWDLIQGEVERLLHIRLLEENEAQRGILSKEDPVVATGMINATTYRSESASPSVCSAVGKVVAATVMSGAVLLLLVGFFLPCINFIISGAAADGPGPNEVEYSTATIVSSPLAADARALNDSVPGTFFLMAVFVVCVLVIPLAEYATIFALTFTGSVTSPLVKKAALAVDVVGGFACLDVFVLSFAVVLAEWDAFINSAIGSQAASLCPGENVADCIRMDSEILSGVYVLAGAVVLGWIVELYFTYNFAQLYHPVEKVRAATCVFDSIMAPSGCLATPITGATVSP